MSIYKLFSVLTLVLFSGQLLAAYTLPNYEKLTLENGLTLYLMEQHEVPLIDISVVVKAGAINDDKQAGLSYLTAENLSLGTVKNTKNEIDQAMDFIGADIRSSADLEFSTIGASFARQDQQQVISLIRDMVVTPLFDQSEYLKHKKRHLLQLEQNKESPKSVINTYFNRLVFGPQGYGAVVQGDSASIEQMNLSDIKSFHQQWYQPHNAAVVVVGDFDAAKMKAQLEQLFGQWQNHTKITATVANNISPAKQAKVLLVNKADAIESTFLIGARGISRSNPDVVGVSVINTILGGRFTSWLNDELRVNSGLTYGARSEFSAYSQTGSFAISTFTKTASTIEAIDLALKTYAKLWQQGIDEPTLNSAKAYVKGQFPPKFETSADLAELLVNMYGYNFDETYINTFEQQVNSLTITKAKQLIQQYFPQQHLQLVIIGKADDIKEDLAKYGQLSLININDIGFN